MIVILKLLVAFIPYWPIKRHILSFFFGYKIAPTSYIGFSWVYPKHLNLKHNARIGHLNIIKGLSSLALGEFSSIGNRNWITAYPKSDKSKDNHFSWQSDRVPSLTLHDHSAVTSLHLLDCTNSIAIGRFSTIAGFASQLLTHSIDLSKNRQSSAPINIGCYTFVGTRVIVLPGVHIADYTVIGAGSVVNKSTSESYGMYAGNPLVWKKPLPKTLPYFTRLTGFVA